MHRVRMTFEEVAIKGTFYWKAEGKRKQQTETFMQTINPFNKAADGSLKTREHIRVVLLDGTHDFSPMGQHRLRQN